MINFIQEEDIIVIVENTKVTRAVRDVAASMAISNMPNNCMV